jgi:transposase InsO family protein
VLKEHAITISMDGKGRWVDNVFIERLWRTVKYEDVYLRAYETPAASREGVGQYFDFYNARRRHSALDRRTPMRCISTRTPPKWQPETRGRFHLRHCPVFGVHF